MMMMMMVCFPDKNQVMNPDKLHVECMMNAVSRRICSVLQHMRLPRASVSYTL